MGIGWINDSNGFSVYKGEYHLFDRYHPYASGRIDIVVSRSFLTDDRNGAIRFRIIMDKDSVELFGNDGEHAATFLVYNDLATDGIEFESDRVVSVAISKFVLEEKCFSPRELFL